MNNAAEPTTVESRSPLEVRDPGDRRLEDVVHGLRMMGIRRGFGRSYSILPPSRCSHDCRGLVCEDASALSLRSPPEAS